MLLHTVSAFGSQNDVQYAVSCICERFLCVDLLLQINNKKKIILGILFRTDRDHIMFQIMKFSS